MYSLEQERATWDPHWRAISDVVNPRRQRFFLGDANKGNRRVADIVENTATLAARTFVAGVMADITNPMKPWFGYGVGDSALETNDRVKEWVDREEQETYEDLLQSGLYRCLPSFYTDWCNYGTALMSIEEHFSRTFCFRTYPIGSYVLDVDQYGDVDTVGRKYRMTVKALVDRFGRRSKSGALSRDNISKPVIDCYERGDLEAWVDVWHVVQPNGSYRPGAIEAERRAWHSSYFEGGVSSVSGGATSGVDINDEPDRLLEEGGFEFFPYLAARWEVVGEDIYGCNNPGMIAHGDVRQLQHVERKLVRGLDKMVDPSMVGPVALKNQAATLESGKITYSNESDATGRFRPTHEIHPGFFSGEDKQEKTRGRIRRAYYEDVMRAFLDDERRQPPTATEIQERYKEKLFELGGPFQMLHSEFLRPLIEKVFLLRLRQRKVATPPPELRGMDMSIEYRSVMSQSLKQVGISSIDRFLLTTVQMSQGDPSVLDIVDGDNGVREYARIFDVPAKFIRSEEEVAVIREERAKQIAAQQESERIATAAKAAKDLGSTPMDQDTVLTRIARGAGVA